MVGLPVSGLLFIFTLALGYGQFVPVPIAVQLGLEGAVAGGALGVGGWIALRLYGMSGVLWRAWIGVSALAWGLGPAVSHGLNRLIDPEGMLLYQALYNAGLGERWAAYLVGVSSGLPAGLLIGLISGVGGRVLARRARRFSQAMDP
jgi:hypothetical protein